LKHIAEDTSFLPFDRCTYEKCWVRYYIISYLANYPDSADTEDGVQWWLWDQWIKNMGPKIQTIMNDLVDEGFVLKFKAKDSQVHYRINDEKYEEIQSLLNEGLN
jgi:hypothetical protein